VNSAGNGTPRVPAYVALGSNLDDPARQVRSALAALGRLPDTDLVARSSLYRSLPVGPPNQPDYINSVAALETALTPEEMLEHLQSIERRHGRTREGERWGPRTLDLDLLLHGHSRRDDPHLVLPHPGLHERAFVLYPLFEIAPDLQVPGLGTLRELIGRVPARGVRVVAPA